MMNSEIITGLFSLGSAAVGALIGIWGTLMISRRQKDQKQLTIYESALTRLLGFEDSIKPKLKIFYDDNPIESLYAGGFFVINMGTVPLNDLEITVCPQGKSKIIDLELYSKNFDSEEDFINIDNKDSSYVIKIKYLNKREHCNFTYTMYGGIEKAKIRSRQMGLDTKVDQIFLSSAPDIVQQAVEEFIEKTPLHTLIFLKLFQKLTAKDHRIKNDSNH